jgi:DNA (cytosine-5)-methyltransferase 1
VPKRSHFRRDARAAAGLFDELIIDNFAGGGGASLGIERASGRAVDIAINHDRAAIEMHSRNHPHTLHLCEDVWRVDPRKVVAGRKVGLMWASPDCKHFSRAKGGKPVEKKIRGLAWIVVKWAKLVRPRRIILENVREFEEWGPLVHASGPDGKLQYTANREPVMMPCKTRKGQTFRRWVGSLRKLGYVVEWRQLNAADYGAPTHRRRLFLIARCDGKPVVWPGPSHGPGRKHAYRTAAECIDWTLRCPSIFLTKQEGRAVGVNRPLAEKTMRRIAMGLKRYVLENPRPFIVRCDHGGDHFRGQPTDKPLGTVTGKHGYGVVTPYLVANYGEAPHQETRGQKVDEPIRTVTPTNNSGVLVSPLLVGAGGPSYSGKPVPVDQPIGTVMTENHRALVTAFLAKHFGGHTTPGIAVDRPIDTITAKDHHGLAAVHLTKFRGGSIGSDAAAPMPTVTAGDGSKRPAGAAHALGVVAANLIHLNHGDKQWSSVEDPMRTQTTANHAAMVYAFLIKYFGTNIGHAADQPLQTVTSKDRFGLITVQVNGEPYIIADIGLRMLTPRELARAQGFPADYILTGTKSSQVARIGNSVCPVMAEVLVRANFETPDRTQKRRKGVLMKH